MTWTLSQAECQDLASVLRKEWLLTNGLGGYAMGTVGLVNTRRYHGHLVAATDPPAVRHVLLAAIEATAAIGGEEFALSSNQYPGVVHPSGYKHLAGFRVGSEAVWRFEQGARTIEKRIRMHEGKNAITVGYRNRTNEPIRLSLRPLVCHKLYHENFREHRAYPDRLEFREANTLIAHQGNELWLGHEGARRTPVQGWYYRFQHDRESDRGLDALDDLFCPCELTFAVGPGEEVTLTAALGSVETPLGPLDEDEERDSVFDALTQAARSHIVETPKRTSIIAGYPWFTDWGRDTMIALPGLCLATGRNEQAKAILWSYAGQIFQGLIPNRFVDSGEQPDYNASDATLWLVDGVYKTLVAEWDPSFAQQMHVAIAEIVQWHTAGTLYGIRVDPTDGLLTQGQAGMQLTWMDAKVGDVVITPRHGKPVEVNGLWINALRVMEWLSNRLGMASDAYRRNAERAEASFARKFFRDDLGYYADTVDPLDVRLRPNQVIAMALPFGPATGELAERALRVIEAQLLTPYGLRTLGPGEHGYWGRFEGPLSELDRAYHQGTVWPWLLGPYVSAQVRINRDRVAARKALELTLPMLSDYGMGGIAEVYDGDLPHRPNGCPWQAWSVGEVLRAWLEVCGDEAGAQAVGAGAP